jgi:polysaccharide transporter, PST family
VQRSAPNRSGNPAAFVAWLAGERVVRLVLSVVIVALVARHLTPAGFGELNFALSIVGAATPLALLGLDAIVVRELVRTPARTGELLGTATVLRLGAGTLCAVGLYALGACLPALGPAQPALHIVCLLLVVQAAETPDLWFRRHVHSRPAVIARVSAIAAGAAIKLLAVVAGAGVATFAWIAVGEAALFGAGLWLAYRQEGAADLRWAWNRALAADLLRQSWGFAAAGALGGLAFRVDQLTVGTLLGDAAVGTYFAALRLIEVPTFLATTVAAALFPALASVHGANDREHYDRAFGVMGALAWITAITASVAAPWLVPFFFGAAYRAAWPALVVQAWATLPYFSGIVRAQYLAIDGRPGAQLASAATALALQASLNALLVPWWGITGAALAFLGTQLIGLWLLPLAIPVLRPMLGPQWRGWWLPWQPAAWPRLTAAFHAEGAT